MSMRTLTILLAVLSVMAAPRVNAENLQLVEQKIKAGLIYNFLKYTSWPQATATAPLIVCTLGNDPFDGGLQPMAGRSVNQRTIEVRVADSHGATACSLLVLDHAKRADWPVLKAALEGKPVLTVGDYEGFGSEGGMIEFTRVDSRIGIRVNTDAVALSHLEIQDRLLKLADAVHARP
jgi:hypothetical protein